MKHIQFVTLSWLLMLTAGAAASAAPQKVLLWPDGAPGAMTAGGEEAVRITDQGEHIISNVHRPALTVYLPQAKHTGVAVIVVPGGGHRELWSDHEGHNVARFLQERGIAAFVLEYRLARAPGSTYTIEGDALNDLKRAIRTVRTRAEWSADSRKVGVMGFSAGGQLAALASTRFDAGSRPDFAALVYPGPWPDLKIGADTPPMWLLCGGDDRPEVLTGITNIYSMLRAAKVPAELHLYDAVPHGFGLRSTNSGPIANWPQQFVDWLRVAKFIEGNP